MSLPLFVRAMDASAPPAKACKAVYVPLYMVYNLHTVDGQHPAPVWIVPVLKSVFIHSTCRFLSLSQPSYQALQTKPACFMSCCLIYTRSIAVGRKFFPWQLFFSFLPIPRVVKRSSKWHVPASSGFHVPEKTPAESAVGCFFALARLVLLSLSIPIRGFLGFCFQPGWP